MSNHRWNTSVRRPVASQPAPGMLFVAFLLLVAWLPFPLGSNRPWSWSLFEVAAFCLAAGLLLVLAWQSRPLPSILARLRGPLLILVAWLLYQLVHVMPLPATVVEWLSPASAALQAESARVAPSAGMTLAVDPGTAIEGLLRNAAVVLMLLLTLSLLDSRRRLFILAVVMLCVGLVEALYGSVAYLAGKDYGGATGSFVNPNHFGAHLVMAICVTLGLLVSAMQFNHEKSGFKALLRRWLSILLSPKAVLLVALFIMLSALFFSSSRGASLSLFLGLLVAILLGAHWHGWRSREAALLPVVLVLAIAAAALLGTGKLQQKLMATEVATEARLPVWQASLAMVEEFPLFGIGEGGYRWLFPAYEHAGVADAFHHNVHNDYLELLIEQGVIGVVLLGAALGLLFWQAGQAFRSRQDPFVRGMVFTSLSGCVALLVNGVFDFNFRIPANVAWFYVLLGMGLAAARLPGKRRDSSHSG